MCNAMLTSVITGDIINSRSQESPEVWLDVLKKALTFLKPDKSQWDIYRGDSFQIELEAYQDSFKAAVYIKACIRTIKGLDVRMAIGFGAKTYRANSVAESMGDAYVFSGETLEAIKKEKLNLRIKTTNKALDEMLNLYFKLALVFMDHWTVNSAEMIKLSIENPNALQSELGAKIGINQNAISTRQKRAHLEEILELDQLYRQKISLL
ncbi:transcriptional regulator [Mariniflexile ostreae]|uniref:Transcriptional regulator n=1 Tax=Mariniflexile ostreae TaxID=1520892 RepID=A0ABV5F7V9_9FLAO